MPEDTLCLDLNAACAGFVYGLHVAECLLPGAARPYALVVGADTLSRVMDFEDRTTCVLFGDGAGAAVLECREGYPELHAVWGSRGDDSSLVAPGVGCDEPSYLHMDGRAVFRFATEVMPRCTTEVLAAAQVSADEVDRFVYHQANKRIVEPGAHGRFRCGPHLGRRPGRIRLETCSDKLVPGTNLSPTCHPTTLYLAPSCRLRKDMKI